MKRVVATVAALALMAPSIAFAGPAAQSLSLSNAAAQPLRASALTGKKLKVEGDNTLLYVVGGGIVLLGLLCIVEICKSNSN